MTFATCRGCDRAFTKEGYGRQSAEHPRLCLDCTGREVAFHGYHQPDVPCIAKYLGKS